MNSNIINEIEFLTNFYPSAIGTDNSRKFSIICNDPLQSIGSMILWPSLNFMFLTDLKIHFVYIGFDPDQNFIPYVLQEIDQYFNSKEVLPIILFKKISDINIEFLGQFYILSRTRDPKSLERFRTINPNIKNGYKLNEVLTLIECDYFNENKKLINPSLTQLTGSLIKWIEERRK